MGIVWSCLRWLQILRCAFHPLHVLKWAFLEESLKTIIVQAQPSFSSLDMPLLSLLFLCFSYFFLVVMLECFCPSCWRNILLKEMFLTILIVSMFFFFFFLGCDVGISVSQSLEEDFGQRNVIIIIIVQLDKVQITIQILISIQLCQDKTR